MNIEPVKYDPAFPPMPAISQPQIATTRVMGTHPDFVVSPLEMATLFAWDEDEQD